MFKTHVRAVRDIRNHYPEIALIVKKQDHVIITNNGKSEAVIIPFEQFEDYQEFAHRRYVMRKLAEAEESVGNPNNWRSVDEFLEEWDEI